MGRLLRIDYDGACQHVIVKAIDSNYIFSSKKVKDTFMMFLEKYRQKHNVKLFAYCLMDNHIHLFIQSGKAATKKELCISAFMRDVLSMFARWYNKLNKRTGPLFNSRFKSFICESTPYFIQIIDYIHKNPYACGKTDSYHYAHSSFKNFLTGDGLCDLKACCAHIGMKREELLGHLNDLMMAKGVPFLDKILSKLKAKQDHPLLSDILIDLGFKLEELRGFRSAIYFKNLRKALIKELKKVRQMNVFSIAQFFSVSKSYIYSVLNSK